MDASLGRIVGQYRLQSLIGHGSMADVYRAVHIGTGKRAAIKIIHSHLFNQSGALERFAREADALLRTQHPNIVRVLEHSFGEDMAYIVMEYIDGGTLEERIAAARNHPLDLKTTLSWMEAICNAVEYAHKQGFVHRDLKPANVLFRSDNTPILTDFGLAYLVDHPRISGSNSITGTPAYLSPEQAHGESGDVRSDVYSLGVILYELLTGVTPFQGNAVSVIMKHASELPPSPRILRRDLPLSVEQVVLKALAKNPATRYPSAQALAEAYRSAVHRAELSDQVQQVVSDSSERKTDGPGKVAAESSEVHQGTPSTIPETRLAASLIGRTKPQAQSAGLLILGVAFVLALLGGMLWLNRGNQEEANDTVTPIPHLAAGSSIRVTIPDQRSVTVLSGCPGAFWDGVVGIATDGQVGRISDRRICRGEWWYEVSLEEQANVHWFGVGWVDGQYLEPH